MKKLRLPMGVLGLLGILMLTGCSTLKPALQEVNETEARKLVLVVEDSHEYETPVVVDSTNYGIPLLTIVSGLVALNTQNNYDQLHKQLTKQGKDLNLLKPENSAQTRFVNLLQSRLMELGLSVEVRSAPFEVSGIAGSTRNYRQPSGESPLKPLELAYGLRLDMGNCSLKTTVPCIRYVWSKLTKSNDQSAVKSYFRNGGTVPEIPFKSALHVNLPGYKAELPQTDADIQSFDQALHQLVEQAVGQLMNDIKGVKQAKY